MVPTKTDLLKLTVKVLATHIVKDAFFDALYHSAEGFSSIDMNATASIFELAVDHALMTRKRIGNVLVAVVTIAHDPGVLVYVFADCGTKSTDCITGNLLSPHGALALGGNQYSKFTCSTPAFVFYAGLIARIAADIGFVKFNDP